MKGAKEKQNAKKNKKKRSVSVIERSDGGTEGEAWKRKRTWYGGGGKFAFFLFLRGAVGNCKGMRAFRCIGEGKMVDERSVKQFLVQFCVALTLYCM